MLFIDKGFEVRDEAKILLSPKQVVYKVKSPVFDTHRSFGVPFQPKLVGYGNHSSEDSVVVFPLIPQYFHNFFEIFTKLIQLRDSGEVFKAIIIHTEERVNGKFKSLIKAEGAAANACHMREFLEWANIEYICMTPDELRASRFGYTYLFFMDTCCEDDATITVKGLRYEVSHFLKVPNHPVILEGVEHLRRYFPTDGPKKRLPIFVSRGKAWDRKYPYEKDLESMMIEYGYAIAMFEDMSWLDQIDLVQNASHIVCEYGSALVNCSLASSKTKVLSINHVEGYYVHPYKYLMHKFGVSHVGYNIKGDGFPQKEIRATLIGTQDFVDQGL